ncbi:MAG: hypothetical protein Q8L10_02960 [Candidatus Moranbacteria bacterium]|nr:hypothetical protein [Candidatus Moranbacteria bacterium]
MKKTLLIAFFLMFGVAVQTQAASTNPGQGSKPESGVSQTGQAGSAVQVQEKNAVQNQGENVQIQTQERNEVKVMNEKENKTQDSAETHRGAVAAFVQGLLAVADRDGGIGQEVRVIAQQQNNVKDRAADLIYAVENRSDIKTFFIGTSYRNLGELRGQTVQSREQIGQLKRLTDKAVAEQDKVELQAQIRMMEQAQANLDDFIARNENKFSLFGWAVRLFR